MSTKTYLYKRADGDNSKRARLVDASEYVASLSGGDPVISETPNPLTFGINSNELIILQLDKSNNDFEIQGNDAESEAYTIINKSVLGLTNDESLDNYDLIVFRPNNLDTPLNRFINDLNKSSDYEKYLEKTSNYLKLNNLDTSDKEYLRNILIVLQKVGA